MAGGANLAPASIPSNSPLSQNFQFDVIFSLKKGNKFSYFINTRIFLALWAVRPPLPPTTQTYHQRVILRIKTVDP